ncbi:MAG TPA: glycosyltransferase family 39 protein [Myxococcota bacterium]
MESPAGAPGIAARLAPIFAVAGAFFGFSAATLGDFGITWDEGVKIYDDDSYLAILQRIEPFDPLVVHIPGYFYVFDAARSLYAKAAKDLLGAPHPVLVHHSFNIAISTACLVLLYLLVLRICGERRLATLSAAALALMPQFVGHSQNNPKDLPAVLMFLLVAWLVVRVADAPKRRNAAGLGIAFGVSLTTRVFAVLLVPILGAWLLLRRRALVFLHWRSYAFALGIAGVAAIASWPALWFRRAEMIDLAAKRLGLLRNIDFDVLYLGRLYPWTDTPWHYTSVHLLITLPLVFIGLLLCVPFAARAWRERSPGKCDALWLGALWAGALLAADLFAPYHYDGIRHVLAAVPAVAILVAGGAEWLAERLEAAVAGLRSPAARRALPWSLALCGLVTAWEIAQVHPYETAYLNPVANGLGGPKTEEWVEVEYWGNAYKEGAEWINRHAEEEARVFFPLGGGQRSGEDIARFYLERPIVRRGTLAAFAETSTPGYLMFITRSAWYDDLIREVRARYAPVYTIRRQRATLLEIYSNGTAPAANARDAADRSAQ